MWRNGREERLKGCRVGQKGEKEERKRDEGMDGWMDGRRSRLEEIKRGKWKHKKLRMRKK